MQAVPHKAQSLRFDWMFSPWQDLLFFFLPVPLAFLLFSGAQAFSATNALLFALITQEVIGLGAFHQGATWFHFLDSKNRQHYLSGIKGIVTFVLAPIALFAATVAGEVYIPALTFFIYVCWSLNHLVQQNIGILLLYQNKTSNEAKISRNVQAWSQRMLALCFSLIFFRRILLSGTELADWLWIPIAISALAGIAYCAIYLGSLGKQLAEGKNVNMLGFLFWIICVACLAPFAFLGKDYDDALMIPLVVHWCQYIGLNYVVAKRKYVDERVGDLPMGHPILTYAAAGFGLVAFILVLTYLQQQHGVRDLPGQLLKGAILGFGMVHYYLDGFIWRFREKFQRETMLPYLTRS